jgi:hypothetical protein
LNAAIRRALLVFAAGGDPHREPGLDEPAVLELARDLDSATRRRQLAEALTGVEREPGSVEHLYDPEVAWRAFACGLLADALGEDDAP